MLIIDNCFKCPDSRFDINSKKWVCIKHDDLILTDANLISEIPIACTRPDFISIPALNQEDRLLFNEIIETLSDEAKQAITLIINTPSKIINSITSVIVGKSNFSKNKRVERKYICNYCNKPIPDGQICYSGMLKNKRWGAGVKFCKKCKKKYNLTDNDFKVNITEQMLKIGLRENFGWKYKIIYKVIKEIRSFPNLI